LGKPQVFVKSPEGITSRYTDEETMEIFTMAMAGKINKQIVATLQAAGVRAVGLSGVDGAVLRAERKKKLIIVDERGRKRIIDGGYTGRIVEVNGQLLNMLLREGYAPVVAPVALGREFEFLNVDGDRAAAHIAAAVAADAVVFLTDVEGLMLDGQLVRELKAADAEASLSRIGAGMDKKVLACIEAVRGGVRKAIITSGQVTQPLARALQDGGTVIAA
jgi:acetylglutamate/LysW-gamma-L-alpha-aminoadipate kinase